MMDTALIDESIQSLILYENILKNDGILSLVGVVNGVEAVHLESKHTIYQEDQTPQPVMSKLLIYDKLILRNTLKRKLNTNYHSRSTVLVQFQVLRLQLHSFNF
jgi:predicted RNA methylase